MKYMTNVFSVISGLFNTAIRSLYPGHAHTLKGAVQFSGSGSKFGDYKCVAAMPISKVCVKPSDGIFTTKTLFLSAVEEPGSECCP